MWIVEGLVGGVNRYLMMAAMVAGCHLGRPPASTASVSIGDVRVAAAEPGLEDALREGLGQALAGRGVLSTGGPRVSLEVRSASTRPAAVGEGEQVHTARLEISITLAGPSARSLVLSDERSYGVTQGRPLEAASARASAFRQLAHDLTEQAASWIVYAPAPESP